jgi:hypothetical protein
VSQFSTTTILKFRLKSKNEPLPNKTAGKSAP